MGTVTKENVPYDSLLSVPFEAFKKGRVHISMCFCVISNDFSYLSTELSTGHVDKK